MRSSSALGPSESGTSVSPSSLTWETRVIASCVGRSFSQMRQVRSVRMSRIGGLRRLLNAWTNLKRRATLSRSCPSLASSREVKARCDHARPNLYRPIDQAVRCRSCERSPDCSKKTTNRDLFLRPHTYTPPSHVTLAS